jgi:hypothetical protein
MKRDFSAKTAYFLFFYPERAFLSEKRLVFKKGLFRFLIIIFLTFLYSLVLALIFNALYRLCGKGFKSLIKKTKESTPA